MQKRMYMGKELYNPFGTLESETVLWTNSNPADVSGFVSQTVTLLNSVQNYDYIKFEYCYNPYQTSKLGEVIVSIDDLIQTGTIDDIKIAMSLVAGSYIYTRIGRYMSDTTFFFNSCSQYNASIALISDAAVVPTRIIGIKKGWQPVYGGYKSVLVSASSLSTSSWYSIICDFNPKFVVFYTMATDSKLYTFIYDVANLELRMSRDTEFEVLNTNEQIKVENNNVMYKPFSSGFVADTRFVICG